MTSFILDQRSLSVGTTEGSAEGLAEGTFGRSLALCLATQQDHLYLQKEAQGRQGPNLRWPTLKSIPGLPARDDLGSQGCLSWS